MKAKACPPYQAAERRAIERRIRKHLGLAGYYAERFWREDGPAGLEDLEAAALSGFLRACDKFDPARDVRFETYAGECLKSAVLDELRAFDHMPRLLRQRLKEISRELRAGAGDEEIAGKLRLSPARYRRILQEIRAARALSLERLRENDASTHLNDQLCFHVNRPPSRPVEEVLELQDLVGYALERLPRRERLVVSLYHVQGLTLLKIAKGLGISEAWACLILKAGLKRMRRVLERIEEKEGSKE